MSDAAVRDLAQAAGIAVAWEDHTGKRRRVTVAVLRRILAALGLPCDNADELRHSQAMLRASTDSNSSLLITATVGEPVAIADAQQNLPSLLRLTCADGTTADLHPLQSCGGKWRLPPIATPGYHRLDLGERSIELAVAPARCVSVDDLAPATRVWGLAVQLYGLRHAGDGGIGDTAALTALAQSAARHGADVIAISPTHAGFAADPGRYRPYSPSSRLFLNPLHADPRLLFGEVAVAQAIEALGLTAEFARLEAADLIDWPAAGRAKLTLLRRLFDDFVAAGDSTDLARDFAAFRAAGGELLQLHARFEALHADRLAADPNAWSWRTWPAPLRDPTSAAVEEFAIRHAREILFHCFLQWLADRSLAAAQKASRAAGMRIGLIADLAVGMESGGGHAWSRQQDILVGLEVGAPPDLFNMRGQNWGLTAFSPRALVAGGFAPFIATLRAGMRNAGGLRIDHAMSLTRLWLIPEGASADEGAYLAYPLDDLLRLAALESWRHRAIVIGEDLGTVPAGFRERLAQTGIAGMRVLWFERKDGRFRQPDDWDRSAVAVTTTHDLPTVAGWWRGADIETRATLGILGEPAERVRRARQKERTALWRAFRAAGVASGRQPAPEVTERAIKGAVGFIARTPAPLALVPLEDTLGLSEQPNMPGTIDEHPNWRRRMPGSADALLDDPPVAARLGIIDRQRRK